MIYPVTPEGVIAISRWFERSEHHRLRSLDAHRRLVDALSDRQDAYPTDAMPTERALITAAADSYCRSIRVEDLS